MKDMVDRDSAVPIYQQLDDIFRQKISTGEWRPDQPIPSENKLNQIYGLSRMTVRGVLTRLVEDGLLFRVAGKGTYVASSKINAVSPAYRGVREQLESMGYSTTTRLISIGAVPPGHNVRKTLSLGPEDAVFEIVRLRSIDGLPISIHRSYIPVSMAPDLPNHDVVNEQLCVVLEKRFGLAMRKVEEHLEAVAATKADAELLGMRRGEPVLQLEDVLYDGAGHAFEYSAIVFRGDKLRLRFDYDC